MGKLIAESWLSRAGLMMMRRRPGARTIKLPTEPEKATTIGVLAFEVASLMSKAVQLWHSLEDEQILRLRGVVLRMEGVRKLVSNDDNFLLGLALAEILDSVGSLARSVARLGSRCSKPVLQRFKQVFAMLIRDDADPYQLAYRRRKMDRKVKKMEKLVAASTFLYQEMELLGELERGLKARGESSSQQLANFRHKIAQHKLEVRRLQETSPWNRSYDYIVRLLGRSLFTIVARIKVVFGFQQNDATNGGDPKNNSPNFLPRCRSIVGLIHSPIHPCESINTSSGPLFRSASAIASTHRLTSVHCVAQGGLPARSAQEPPCSNGKWPVPGLPLMGCVAAGNQSPVPPSCIVPGSGFLRSSTTPRITTEAEETGSEARFQLKFLIISLSSRLLDSSCKLLTAPPTTLGAAALALHHANIIIFIEKLVASPESPVTDARDDLYDMLPARIRAALRIRLKPYARTSDSSAYDPVVATGILQWLAPLAHNMIRWQSEKNFEKKHLVSRTNVLLLQTLYFADRIKTEAAITELLVVLNHFWRSGTHLNAKGTVDRLSRKKLHDASDCSQCLRPKIEPGDVLG